MSKSRVWIFTLNHPLQSEVDTLTQCQVIHRMIAVLEKGSLTETVHYQGLLQLSQPRALSYLHNLIPRAHWEIRRGTMEQALNYVLKTLDLDKMSGNSVNTSMDVTYLGNGGVLDGAMTYGLNAVICKGLEGSYADIISEFQGKSLKPVKERLAEIQIKLLDGGTEEEISIDHFEEWVKYGKRFKDFKMLHTKMRDFKTTVMVIQGPTGTGKSKYCIDEHPGAYWKTRDQWWDGYELQETIILDEFYGWLQFDVLLRLTDRYPFQVEVKGGKVNFTAKKIIFTTNNDPRSWYPKIKEANWKAFCRRVEEWWVYGKVVKAKYLRYEDAQWIEDKEEETNSFIDRLNKLSIS